MNDSTRQSVIVTDIGDTIILQPAVASPRGKEKEFPVVEQNQDHTIGTHEHCKGNVEVKQVSQTHRVLLCTHCNLRVPIPLEVCTEEELLIHFQIIGARYRSSRLPIVTT